MSVDSSDELEHEDLYNDAPADLDDMRAPLRVGAVYGRNVHLAQRYAVLQPLTAKIFQDEDVRLAIARLWQMRRHRLRVLRHAGWTLLSQKLNYQFAMHCPFFGAKTGGSLRKLCNRPLFCPFCWARMVVGECFDRLEYAYYAGRRQQRFDKASRQLVPTEPAMLDMFEMYHLAHADSLEEALMMAQDLSFPGRCIESFAVGSYALNTIECPNGEWKVSRRGLVLTDLNAPAPGVPVENGWHELEQTREAGDRYVRIKVHRGISKRGDLAPPVGRVCQYPLGLLQHDPEKIAQLLNARHGLRFSSYKGLLRNRTLRENRMRYYPEM